MENTGGTNKQWLWQSIWRLHNYVQQAVVPAVGRPAGTVRSSLDTATTVVGCLITPAGLSRCSWRATALLLEGAVVTRDKTCSSALSQVDPNTENVKKNANFRDRNNTTCEFSRAHTHAHTHTHIRTHTDTHTHTHTHTHRTAPHQSVTQRLLGYAFQLFELPILSQKLSL